MRVTGTVTTTIVEQVTIEIPDNLRYDEVGQKFADTAVMLSRRHAAGKNVRSCTVTYALEGRSPSHAKLVISRPGRELAPPR